jgi:hypothetical protein
VQYLPVRGKDGIAGMSAERRVSRRYKVDARCELTGAVSGRFSGRTGDISRTGLLVLLSPGPLVWLPLVGERVQVDVELPANGVYGPKCLRCWGDVVRAALDRGSAPKVGVGLDQMEFAAADGLFRSVDREAGFQRLLMRVK